eukprot:gene5160-2398_t
MNTLAAPEIQATLDRSVQTMSSGWSGGTWEGVASVARQFTIFSDRVRSLYPEAPLEVVLMTWIQAKLDRQEILPQTAVAYMRKVNMFRFVNKLPALDTPMLALFRRSLNQMIDWSGIERNQAQPAQLQEVIKVMDSTASLHTKRAVLLAWAQMARIDDTLHLTGDMIEIHPETKSLVVFWGRTKTRRAFGEGDVKHTCLGRLFPDALRLLQPVVGTEQVVVRSTYQKILTELKTIHPDLTNHSFKRGSMQAAASHSFPLSEIMKISNHRSEDMVRRYIGRHRADAINHPVQLEISGAINNSTRVSCTPAVAHKGIHTTMARIRQATNMDTSTQSTRRSRSAPGAIGEHSH